jgi:hypothetical protein
MNNATRRALRIVVTQLQTLTSNENAYDDTTKGEDHSISFEELWKMINADPAELSLDNHLCIEEGYYNYKINEIEHNEDCDHGPCVGTSLSNGWIMWTYRDKPGLISFHPNFHHGMEE